MWAQKRLFVGPVTHYEHDVDVDGLKAKNFGKGFFSLLSHIVVVAGVELLLYRTHVLLQNSEKLLLVADLIEVNVTCRHVLVAATDAIVLNVTKMRNVKEKILHGCRLPTTCHNAPAPRSSLRTSVSSSTESRIRPGMARLGPRPCPRPSGRRR